MDCCQAAQAGYISVVPRATVRADSDPGSEKRNTDFPISQINASVVLEIQMFPWSDVGNSASVCWTIVWPRRII